MSWSPACPSTCKRDSNPVCGTNAVTYDGICELKVATCFDASVTLAYPDKCRSKWSFLFKDTHNRPKSTSTDQHRGYYHDLNRC